MTLLVKASPSGRVVVDVTPATAGWTHVGFKALRLGAGDEESLATGARELCITVLSGQVDVHVGAHVYRALGSRGSGAPEDAAGERQPEAEPAGEPPSPPASRSVVPHARTSGFRFPRRKWSGGAPSVRRPA